MALHTMAVLQAYQADVLKEMDEGAGLTPEAVKELRKATDLALRATKHTAVEGSMAGSVAAGLWLNLTEIHEKKVFLLDAPISQTGLFGEAVSSVVEKFLSAKSQSAALKQFMPRRMRDPSKTPSTSMSRERSLPRKEPTCRSCALALPPPPPPRLRSGEPVAGIFPTDDPADGWTDSSGRLVCHCRPEGCLLSYSGYSAAQEVPFVCFWKKGLPAHSYSLWPGLGPEAIQKVHRCCSSPFEAPGNLCTQLPGRLAHTGPLQRVSELSQRYRPPPHSCSWPQNEHQKECSHPFSTNCVFGGSFGLRSNAGPSGSCPDLQFQCMFGLLQARPSCLCEHFTSQRSGSTRTVASSQALFRGVLLEDICVAAGWSSPHAFIRFYNLDLDTALGSQVLSVWTGRVCCLLL